MSANNADPYAWDLDREIVLSRVFDAPRALVFKVWTDAEAPSSSATRRSTSSPEYLRSPR